MIAPDKAAMLSSSNLKVGYHHHVLFGDLNLQLSSGQLVCLMGPNGCGKSTLLRSLAGLQSPLSGEVNGIDEKNVAVVLTDKVNASFMTVHELVTYGRYPYLDWNVELKDQDKKIIRNAIDATHLSPLLDRKLFELSDGQLQMCMIARALAQDTPVLILDEPTSHLDLNNRLEIMNMLRTQAHQNGKVVLMATHELDLALQCADVIWLAKEKTIVQGIPEDLVLDGSFDEVFQFKGYDLKTGKVQHVPWRKITIGLSGNGPIFLWTKNALERNGFEVFESGDINVVIDMTHWAIGDKRFKSIENLIGALVVDF